MSILVGGNAGEVAFTVLGTAFGGRAPLGTRQLLLVNLLTDMFPALAVAVAAPRRTPARTATVRWPGTRCRRCCSPARSAASPRGPPAWW